MWITSPRWTFSLTAEMKSSAPAAAEHIIHAAGHAWSAASASTAAPHHAAASHAATSHPALPHAAPSHHAASTHATLSHASRPQVCLSSGTWAHI